MESVRFNSLKILLYTSHQTADGNTTDGMVAGVEGAYAFVPVLTEKYKESSPCRQGK